MEYDSSDHPPVGSVKGRNGAGFAQSRSCLAVITSYSEYENCTLLPARIILLILFPAGGLRGAEPFSMIDAIYDNNIQAVETAIAVVSMLTRCQQAAIDHSFTWLIEHQRSRSFVA